MIIAIHQPQYLPWLGYFDKIDKADVFCYLDNVQYKKNEWQNRNRIKTDQGEQWITVPVRYRFPQKINEVRINNTTDWKRKHLHKLMTNYNRSPFFKEYEFLFEQIFSKEWECLSDLNIYLIETIKTWFNLQKTSTVIASTLTLSDDPTDRLIDICKSQNCDTYLSGKDGKNYLNQERFNERGVKVIFQNFNHPVYPQLFRNFLSHLSIVDLLFNCGSEGIYKIRECNPFSKTYTL